MQMLLDVGGEGGVLCECLMVMMVKRGECYPNVCQMVVEKGECCGNICLMVVERVKCCANV